jgi:type III pantothenate kinase
MRSGIYWGSVGLVESLIVRIAETYGVAPRVFLTGGAAGFLAIELKWKCELMPTLTLEGLAILAGRQDAKRGQRGGV